MDKCMKGRMLSEADCELCTGNVMGLPRHVTDPSPTSLGLTGNGGSEKVEVCSLIIPGVIQ